MSSASVNKNIIGSTYRRIEVALHSVGMQHGDLLSNEPTLRRFAGKMLSQPFKTFAAPLHNVSKFPLTQRNPKTVPLSF